MSEQSIKQTPAHIAPAPRLRLLRGAGIWIGALIVVLVLPMIFSSGHSVSMLTQMCSAIVFALSYNMLLGQGGMLSFGHAVFSGLGGFIAMHVLNAVNDGALVIPLELMPIVGGLGGLAFAIPFGWISTKRAGVTFAMISLGIAELVAASALMFTGFFGGESGISSNRVVDHTLFGFLGVSYGPSIEVYYLAGAWMLIATFAMYLLTLTPLGRMANAVRDNPERAQFVGYDPHLVRFLQFSLAGFFAGVAGGLTVINYEILTADALSAIASGTVLVMAFIGGIGFFFGPILGAILITYLQTSLSSFSEAWLMYFGLIFVGMVMYAPHGLAGIVMAHRPALRSGRAGKLLLSYLVAAVPTALLLVGLISLIEMGYHLSTAYMPEYPISLFGVEVNVTQLRYWLGAVAITAVGLAVFLWVMRLIRRAWHEVNAALGGERT